MQRTYRHALFVGLALLAGACGSWFFDFTGTRCGDGSECGSGYHCSQGICEKGIAGSDDAGQQADAGADAGQQADAGQGSGDAGPGADGGLGGNGSPCSVPVDCLSKSCLGGACSSSAIFFDSFDQEPAGDAFGAWSAKVDCTSYPECTHGEATVTVASAPDRVFDGAGSALLAMSTLVACPSPYWAYLVKDTGASQASLKVGAYVKWSGAQPSQQGSILHALALSAVPPDNGTVNNLLVVGLLIGSVGEGRWVVDDRTPNYDRFRVTDTHVATDLLWHYLELRFASASFELLLDGASIGTGPVSAFAGARYVYFGEPSGCGQYWFAADLLSIGTP